MWVFGGMIKGERNRTRIGVSTVIAAQARIEGRFLAGRPPCGYTLADAEPHQNPAKAAAVKRVHKLALDLETTPVGERIFPEFIAGKGIFAIAERPTRDGIPSPSAYGPERNTHRSGIAGPRAVRAILTDPHYTGYRCGTRSAPTKSCSTWRPSPLGTPQNSAGTRNTVGLLRAARSPR